MRGLGYLVVPTVDLTRTVERTTEFSMSVQSNARERAYIGCPNKQIQILLFTNLLISQFPAEVVDNTIF